jgi:hypothetical protein
MLSIELADDRSQFRELVKQSDDVGEIRSIVIDRLFSTTPKRRNIAKPASMRKRHIRRRLRTRAISMPATKRAPDSRTCPSPRLEVNRCGASQLAVIHHSCGRPQHSIISSAQIREPVLQSIATAINSASLKDSASSSPTTVFAGSENQVAASYADEVMVVTETWDHAARLKSCRLDAEVRKEIQIGSKHCGRKTNISIKKNPAPDESQDPWPHLNNRKIDLNVKRRL